MQENLKLNLYTRYIPTIEAIIKKNINSIFYIKNHIIKIIYLWYLQFLNFQNEYIQMI